MNWEVLFSSMRNSITVLATLVLVKYFVYLVLAPWYLVKLENSKLKIKNLIKSGKIPKTYHPLVSIIIPAWNEEVGVITSVNSALASTYDNIEIIVVNDGSTDNTEKIVKDFIKKYNKKPIPGKKINLYSKPNAGKALAMNHGIKKSKGDIVVTMDADSAHGVDAIKNLVFHFQDPEIHAVVGNVQVTNASNIVGMLQKMEYIFGFYFKRVHSLFNAEYIFGGACAAFRKSTTFDKIGYFDDSTKTEDIEYSMRTQLHGLKSLYAEDVVAYTEGASTLNGLYKQRTRWKKGRIDVFIKYRELFFSANPLHGKFMSWVVLPYAAMGDLQLLFEPMFVTLIWVYTFVSGDYVSLGISSLFVFFTFLSAILFGEKHTNRMYFLFFPSFWLLFYILVGVEFFALVKSIELYLSKKDVVWQSWQRVGIANTI